MFYYRELEDRPPSPVAAADGPVTYEVLEGGTRIGARMLLGSDGFTYNVKVLSLAIYFSIEVFRLMNIYSTNIKDISFINF